MNVIGGLRPQSSRRVDPDPSITSAIGRHHSFVSAIADLVDNALDAGARHVLVRLLQSEGQLSGLLVADDGSGMDSAAVDDAMTYARRRAYGDRELGHFGIGMKAASLSQADHMFVWSKAFGVPAVGRGMAAVSRDGGPMVDTYTTVDVEKRFRDIDTGFELCTGSIVELREPREILRSKNSDEQTTWVEDRVEELRLHLGVVLHRFLVRHDVEIVIDVLAEDTPFLGTMPREVVPIDPVRPPYSGRSGYPTVLEVELPRGPAALTLTIWPDEESGPAWNLGGRPPSASQGLYVYRHDRLLQAGGWNGLTAAREDLARARVSLEIDDVVAPYVTINPEKTGVQLSPVLVSAILTAPGSGDGPFRMYTDDVKNEAREARKRSRRPIRVPEPGLGFSVRLHEAFADNAEFTDGDEVDLRWRSEDPSRVFTVDPEQRCIWLNSRYRAALGGRPKGRVDDAPLAKTLLHVLMGKYASGSYLGQRAKREIDAWNNVLLAAIDEYDLQTESARGRHALDTPTTTEGHDDE